MNNKLNLNKYLHSINSSAAIKAVQDKAVPAKEKSESVSDVDMQFNQEYNNIQHTKSWIS